MNEMICCGDLVRLKTDGSELTVEKIDGEEVVCVPSKPERERVVRKTFKLSSLEIIKGFVDLPGSNEW